MNKEKQSLIFSPKSEEAQIRSASEAESNVEESNNMDDLAGNSVMIGGGDPNLMPDGGKPIV